MGSRWIRNAGDFLRSLGFAAWNSVRAWSWRRWLLVGVGCVALLAAAVLVDVPDVAALRQWSEDLGPWFVVAFTAAYVLFTQFPIPRTVWTVAAGVLFGPWLGLGVSLVALTISATLSLLVVRRLLGEWIRPHLSHPAVFTINSRLESRGWLAIASLRLVAGVPFCLVNYVAALTPIPVAHFALATLFGSIPTTAIGVFLGDALSGQTDPLTIVALIAATMLGVAGLLLDTRLPARPSVSAQVKHKE
nr:TVP38/TMEM64 family protein [uncultured Corynebacterium sp.]